MGSPVFPDSRIKILRIIGRLNVGGPAIHVINLCAGLDPARYQQTLVVGTESAGEGSMLDYAVSRGVRPQIIPEIVTTFRLTPRDGKALIKLYQIIRRDRPHIVHTHTAKAGFLGRIAARMAGVPVVVHTFHGHVLHGYYGPAKSRLLRLMEKSLSSCTDRLLTVSEEVKKELVAYGVAKAEQISVIPLGFDLEPFINSHAHRDEFRRELGFGREAKLVGIVGRLFPIKNHALFLESAARISANDSAARFVIVGDGELRPTLEERARDLGIADRIVFTGWRRDLPRICADLNVLVVSSDNEGTPVSAIEAMASSCPVVATRVGGLPDLIRDHITGRLVAPRDAAALACAVTDLLQRPETANELGRRAMEAVRERFAVTRLISDVDHFYGRLLEEKAIFFASAERYARTEVT
ncbi:MAG: glycosyltransferase [Deltaproteobacteria bacterium]|nr:glycosyltransferase [Deltaproteobacteria bacterium]